MATRTARASRADATAMELFRAFADPTRLRLLNLLAVRELCVCELMAVVGEVQPKVSRHLALLRRVGLVEGRREGQWVYYRLARPGTELHRRLLACLGPALSEHATFGADVETLRRTAVCLGPADSGWVTPTVSAGRGKRTR